MEHTLGKVEPIEKFSGTMQVGQPAPGAAADFQDAARLLGKRFGQDGFRQLILRVGRKPAVVTAGDIVIINVPARVSHGLILYAPLNRSLVIWFQPLSVQSSPINPNSTIFVTYPRAERAPMNTHARTVIAAKAMNAQRIRLRFSRANGSGR